MKKAFHLLFFSFLMLVMGACSIQKKTHFSGYNVQWKTENKVAKSVSHRQSTTAQNPIQSRTPKKQQSEIVLIKNLKDQAPFLGKETENIHSNEKINEAIFFINLPEEETSEASKLEPKRKAHLAVIVGIFLSTLGLAYAGIILGLLGVLFSIIGIANIVKNRKKYVGLTIGIIGIIIGIFSVVGAFIVLNSNTYPY